MPKPHTFHIPVMGIGFTVDTPIKVSHLGIDSVISLVDDILLEKLRKVYSEKFSLPYTEIHDKDHDSRAKRITSYLNMLNNLAEKKFDEFKNSLTEKSNGIREYFQSLPDSSKLKQEFKELQFKFPNFNEIKQRLKDSMIMGSIDVNIMTKVDKTNYRDGKELPAEFNDAHAALRGFAESDLKSSIILSAGMNPRLYAYMENFADFYPNAEGEMKKKIILKVSDFKSALIQGKYFAKKGLWVSEFRIESGLNCGGHAFATDGFLLGPILSEFKAKRNFLIHEMESIYFKALEIKNKIAPASTPKVLVTAQGGVGTSEEHEFLLDHYNLDSVGWGSPFLLVPEATTMDDETRQKLVEAREEDLYLSNISPLGVPFNSLRGNTKDIEKQELINKGKPGSACPKKFVMLNTELTERGICTASRTYQLLKIKALEKLNLPEKIFNFEKTKITDKSCVCVGLGTAAYLAHGVDTAGIGPGVSVCPGPNTAYFSKIVSLKSMVDHIYGRTNVIQRTDRPNMFVKELNLYIDYLKKQIEEAKFLDNHKNNKYFTTFAENLTEGVNYYKSLFGELRHKFVDTRDNILTELETGLAKIEKMKMEINKMKLQLVEA